MDSPFLNFVGFMTCGVLIIGSVCVFVALIVQAFETWSQIKQLHTRLDDKATLSAVVRLDTRIDENDAAIEQLVEDFDEFDTDVSTSLADTVERLTVHNTFITDIGKRMAEAETRITDLEYRAGYAIPKPRRKGAK